jgi:hypothetical protein
MKKEKLIQKIKKVCGMENLQNLKLLRRNISMSD